MFKCKAKNEIGNSREWLEVVEKGSEKGSGVFSVEMKNESATFSNFTLATIDEKLSSCGKLMVSNCFDCQVICVTFPHHGVPVLRITLRM